MKSEIIVVNEQDESIGYKDRYAIVKGDIYRVSALWLKNSRGDSLLARRALKKVYDPGKWGPAVAGTVEKDESYEINIHKEIEEEIGLKDVKPQLGPKVRMSSIGRDYFVQWYTLELDKPAEEFIIDKEEVDQVKWFSPAELERAMDQDPEGFLKNMKRYTEIFYQ
jgi:isopentenyl-diphosphate delta-isomerase